MNQFLSGLSLGMNKFCWPSERCEVSCRFFFLPANFESDGMTSHKYFLDSLKMAASEVGFFFQTNSIRIAGTPKAETIVNGKPWMFTCYRGRQINVRLSVSPLNACQVFHCNLPLYLSEEIERIQRRALHIIFPDCGYSEGLAKAGLTTLYDRRSALCKELFSDINTQGNHKLSHLLPARSQLSPPQSAWQTGSEIALSLAIVWNIF